MKDTSFWLTLELVRIVDFCCVRKQCSLKHEKVKSGQVGTRNVGLVWPVCQLTLFRLVNYWLIFYQSDLFLSFLRS